MSFRYFRGQDGSGPPSSSRAPASGGNIAAAGQALQRPAPKTVQLTMAEVKSSIPAPANADPSRHKALERLVHDHVAARVDDRRFVVPTSFGPRPISLLQRDIDTWDQGLRVKELLVEMDRPDFSLQEKLPLGRGFDVRLSRQVLLAFNQTLGHVRFASLPPTRALAEGRSPGPLTAAEVRDGVANLPSVGHRRGGGGTPAPMTLILFSSAGFDEDARQTARGFVEGPPTIDRKSTRLNSSHLVISYAVF